MICNIIYDSRRPEKYEPLITEMARQGISYMLWDAVILPNIVASINASHREIVTFYKRQGATEVCIMEDDVMFPSEIGWAYFLGNKPLEFDLYLGGCYSKITTGIVEKSIVYTETPVGLHCYIIHERYFNQFLNTDPREHIDTAQGDKGVFKVCYPMPALQRKGWSANNCAKVDYNTLLKPEDVYEALP